MRLEPELWDALRDICVRENVALNDIVKKIESTRHAGGRTSAVRVFIVNYLRNVKTEAAADFAAA